MRRMFPDAPLCKIEKEGVYEVTSPDGGRFEMSVYSASPLCDSCLKDITNFGFMYNHTMKGMFLIFIAFVNLGLSTNSPELE